MSSTFCSSGIPDESIYTQRETELIGWQVVYDTMFVCSSYHQEEVDEQIGVLAQHQEGRATR
jgi:hypothetical protein